MFPADAVADEMTVKEERLGPWHYLYPLDYFEGGDSKRHRDVSVPTAIAFGSARDRIACLLPGSWKLAEFKAGHFQDLRLPEQWAPLSLAADQAGVLFCLVQHTEAFSNAPDEWKKRWAIEMTDAGWKPAVPIPYTGCDRLEFDSENRLWALGVAPTVGFFKSGSWTTFAYSDDRHLGFLPLRLAEENGETTLFAWEQRPSFGGVSRMKGTLIFRAGAFHRDPKAPTAKSSEAATRRNRELTDDTMFDRAGGYVCHTKALNAQFSGPRTVLRAANYVVVSLGNEGLVWADATDLKQAAPLPSDEWEAVQDVSASPQTDKEGNLWIGRGRKMTVVRREKTEVLAGELPEGHDFTIDFDQLNRPWVMGWHGSYEGLVIVCSDGKLTQYPSLVKALQGEAAKFKPGRVLAFAIRSTDGTLAVCGGYFNECTILDSKGSHCFSAHQIDPDQRPPTTGHGYNPFRDAEPWCDSQGRIYTRVDGKPFLYDGRKGRWMAASDATAKATDAWPLAESLPDFTKPFEGRIGTGKGTALVFKGFHFYSVENGKERQLEFGVNPLAYYPFWSGWYRSPGMTRPRVDPSGKIWISSLGPYAENREWWVLQKPPQSGPNP